MARFYADNYFHIGHAHLGTGKPCQDYSFSGVYNGVGFGAVSDGCSSGRHTDIGSRVITLSTASFVRQLQPVNLQNAEDVRAEMTRVQARLINITQVSLGLELMDMLATSSYVCLSSFGGFVHLKGDGAIAIIHRDGKADLYSYQWNQNKPFYPAYIADNYERFVKEHGGNLDAPAVRVEQWLSQPGPEVSKVQEYTMSLAEGIAGASHHFGSLEVQNDLAFVAVFTDGVSQVANTVGGPDVICWQDVVKQLIGFKNLNGDFVKRRTISFLKEMRKKNIGPLDDLGCAVVRVESEEGEIGNGT